MRIIEVRQQIAAVLISPALEGHRTYANSDGEVAQLTISTHPVARFRHSMTMRRVRG